MDQAEEITEEELSSRRRAMSFNERSNIRGVNAILVIVMIIVGFSAGGAMKVKDLGFYSSIQGQLPRGPVPPSDPSPCHNRVKLQHETEDTYGHAHFIICP